MLASIFGKVTASLGKTFVFTGLLPAAVLILAVASYLTPLATLTSLGSALADADSWKKLAWLGCLWLVLGFFLYALRAPLFSWFQVVPASFIGRRLLFSRIAKRERLRRVRVELEQVKTAINWLTNRGLERAKIGDMPFWLVRSYPGDEKAIARSQAGRNTLTDVDRTVGDALNLTVSESDVIAEGIFALYRLARDKRSAGIESTITDEVAAWRFAMVSREAKAIVRFVDQDADRKVAKAFHDCQQFGQGPYIFPTKIGNLISALDDYGLKRYGIDTATLWDRLWWVLPREVKADVSDARVVVEALLNLLVCVFLAIAAILSLHVAKCGTQPSFTGPCSAVPATAFTACALIISRLVYRGAAFAMEVMAVKMTSLIDMYRLATLGQLGFSPKTVAQERAISSGLKGLFTQAAALDGKLELTAAAKAEPKEQKPDDKDDKTKDEKDSDKPDEADGGKSPGKPEPANPASLPQPDSIEA
jgi:hypothetical protein